MSVVPRASGERVMTVSPSQLQTAIRDAMSSLSGRVEKLEGENLAVRKENAEMKAAIDKIRLEAAVVIKGLNEKIAALTGEIATLGGELDSEKGKRAELEGKVAALNSEIKTLTEKVDKQAADILSKEAEVTQKSAEAEADQAAIKAIQSNLDALILKNEIEKKQRMEEELNRIIAKLSPEWKKNEHALGIIGGPQAAGIAAGAVVGPIGAIVGGFIGLAIGVVTRWTTMMPLEEYMPLMDRGRELSQQLGRKWPPKR